MTTSKIRERLARMSTSQIARLAEAGDLAERTLWSIRSGKTSTASEATKIKIAAGLRIVGRSGAKKRKPRVSPNAKLCSDLAH